MFNIPEADLRDSMSAKEIPRWDSMNYLLFIAELEKNFNITFNMDEVLGAQNLGMIKGMIRAKGKSI